MKSFSCLVIMILLALLTTSLMPTQVIGAQKSTSSMTLLGTLGRLHISDNRGAGLWLDFSHYCHLGSVYLVAVESRHSSLALVWNHDTGKPLKCVDYQDYIATDKSK